MKDEVLRTIRRERLLAPEAPVHVAVSGGVDSMVMLHVLHALGHRCTVLHVDHGLRGAQSADDACFVADQAQRLGLPFLKRQVDVRARMAGGGMSLQMAARVERLQALETMMAPAGGPCALAHHADDAVETLFIHLLRGTGLLGWAAIPPRSGPFIRPLLGVDRNAIAAYAAAHEIPFREDPSNADPHYLRNRIRHQVLPLLEAMRPGAHRTLARSVSDLRRLVAMALPEGAAAAFAPEPLGPYAEAWSLAPILAAPAPQAALAMILRPYGLHPDVITRILEAAVGQRVGALFPLGDRSLVVDRARLVIADMEPPPAYTMDLSTAVVGRVGALDWQIEQGQYAAAGPGEAVLRLDALAPPLALRPWRRGDRMRPLGLGGSKLVSDLLTEARVPRNMKPHAYVLQSADHIAWLVGVRVAEGFQAGAGPGPVVRFRVGEPGWYPH